MGKLLSGITAYDDRQLFSVVRVETTKKQKHEDEDILEVDDESLASLADSDDDEPITVGQGVAYEMKAMGNSILRGAVLKQHEDGKWIVGFTNGRKLKMKPHQVEAARALFEEEVTKLVKVKMNKADASSLSEVAVQTSAKKIRQPVLIEGQEDATEEYEKLFEEKFQGALPHSLVGIEFSNIRDLSSCLQAVGVTPVNCRV